MRLRFCRNKKLHSVKKDGDYINTLKDIIKSIRIYHPYEKNIDLENITELITYKNFSAKYFDDDYHSIKGYESSSEEDENSQSSDEINEFTQEEVNYKNVVNVGVSRVKSLTRIALEEVCKHQYEIHQLFELYPSHSIWIPDDNNTQNIYDGLAISIAKSVLEEFYKSILEEFAKITKENNQYIHSIDLYYFNYQKTKVYLLIEHITEKRMFLALPYYPITFLNNIDQYFDQNTKIYPFTIIAEFDYETWSWEAFKYNNMLCEYIGSRYQFYINDDNIRIFIITFKTPLPIIPFND
uniref:Uncharacterized protein n=1 Tax=viral metagenome TaxID=1070528 RepID=A0A6C0E7J9_9ZZZZ